VSARGPRDRPYNNLRCKKQITWSQGCTHGWWPGGMKKKVIKAEARDADDAELAQRVAEDCEAGAPRRA
jgi:hypothetical protein